MEVVIKSWAEVSFPPKCTEQFSLIWIGSIWLSIYRLAFGNAEVKASQDEDMTWVYQDLYAVGAVLLTVVTS